MPDPANATPETTTLGASTTPGVVEAPPAEPTSQVGSSSSVPSTSGLSQVPTPAPATAPAGGAAPANDYVGVREALAGYGIDLRGQFQDDHAALQHLALAYRQAQQGNELAQYGQLYLQHADQFNAWMRQQQEAQQRQQQEQQNWWKAPDYDPAWASKLYKDQTTGELRVLPGNDPNILNKYNAWVDHQRSFVEKLARDPVGTIRPGIEQVAREVAQQLIGQQLGGYREQVAARSFVDENSSWLHARDEQGQVVLDPRTGKPSLSEMGNRFARYVQEAQTLGLRDVASQQRYALGLVQRDYLYSQYQSQQPNAQQQQQAGVQQVPATPSPNDQAKQQFLQQAAGHRPNAAGSVQPTSQGNAQTPSQNADLDLRSRLAQRFQANGYQLSTPVTGR